MTTIDAPPSRRPDWLWYLGLPVAGLLWWLAYGQLIPFSEWVVSLLPVERHSHTGEAIAFFVYDVPKVLLLLALIVFITGVLRSWFSPEKTRAMLAGRRQVWGYPLAALLGVMTPFCSCSSVPLFIGFVSAGILDTEEGILTVMEKLGEVRPNVRLWYRDEGQFQQALETGEIPMGQYYHDVTGLAAADGKPVRSTFPIEGGVLDSGSWCVSKASQKIEESQVFIDYMCQPEIQAKLARNVGTAPTVRRDLIDLTDEEFAAVSSDIDPIVPRYDMYDQRGDWLNQKWSELIAG